MFKFESIWDLDSEVGWGTTIVGVAAVGLGSVFVLTVIGADKTVEAIALLAIVAFFTVKAGAALGTNANFVV